MNPAHGCSTGLTFHDFDFFLKSRNLRARIFLNCKFTKSEGREVLFGGGVKQKKYDFFLLQ